MKICLINHLYRPFIRGGAENVVETIADGFIKNNNEVIVIATKPRFWRGEMPKLPYRVFYLGSFFSKLSRMPYAVRFFWHIGNILDIFTAVKVKRILLKENPDLVITNNLAGLSYLIPSVVKKKKIKLIHILHDIQLLHPSGLLIYGDEKKIDNFCSRIYQFFLKRLFSQVDAVISPSRWLLDLHTQKGFFSKAEKKIASNPIKTGTKYEGRGRNGVFQLLYATQIEEHKGIFFLVKAFLKLQKGNQNLQIKLKIVGGGQGEKKLRELIAGNSDIEYLGRVSSEKVSVEMGESSLLVVPSLCYENYPTVILEGVSNTVPVLAADIGGSREIIDKYGGILFKPRDIDDLVAKINLAIKNPQLLEGIKSEYLQYYPQLVSANSDYIKLLLSI